MSRRMLRFGLVVLMVVAAGMGVGLPAHAAETVPSEIGGATVVEQGPERPYYFIAVPPRYVYDPARGPFHDYCTRSPDQYNGADFRGPCAHHDLCYEDRRLGKDTCDGAFRLDLGVNCRWTHRDGSPGQPDCYRVAETYYAAVVVAAGY